MCAFLKIGFSSISCTTRNDHKKKWVHANDRLQAVYCIGHYQATLLYRCDSAFGIAGKTCLSIAARCRYIQCECSACNSRATALYVPVECCLKVHTQPRGVHRWKKSVSHLGIHIDPACNKESAPSIIMGIYQFCADGISLCSTHFLENSYSPNWWLI